MIVVQIKTMDSYVSLGDLCKSGGCGEQVCVRVQMLVCQGLKDRTVFQSYILLIYMNWADYKLSEETQSLLYDDQIRLLSTYCINIEQNEHHWFLRKHKRVWNDMRVSN